MTIIRLKNRLIIVNETKEEVAKIIDNSILTGNPILSLIEDVSTYSAKAHKFIPKEKNITINRNDIVEFF